MNQPTREEFDQLKKEQQQIKEDVRILKQQHTEPILATTRIEVASADVLNQLKALEQGLQEFKQEATKRRDTAQEDTNILKIQMEGARADILQIRESQADLRDRLIEHSEDLKAIKEKQDAHSDVLSQLVTIGESHTGRFDQIDATMATKDDISRLEGIMMQMLNRLPKTEGE